MTPAAGVLAVAVAAALDATVEEFPEPVHPVALFGRAVAAVDSIGVRPRVVGALAAISLPLTAAAAAGGAVVAAGRVGPLAGGAAAGLVVFGTTSLRMLLSAAFEVVALADEEPEAARSAAVALVGRDTAALGGEELRSAAVESVAENLADGLVAPLAAFAAGVQVSLAVGAAAAAWVKAVNTMDSMLGYPDKPVGTAAARLDDIVVWVPARLSALLLAVAAGAPRALFGARRWVDDPASPNSGWPMATLAAALDVRLQKPGAYRLNPGRPLPSPERARRGVRVVGIAGALAFLCAGVAAWS